MKALVRQTPELAAGSSTGGFFSRPTHSERPFAATVAIGTATVLVVLLSAALWSSGQVRAETDTGAERPVENDNRSLGVADQGIFSDLDAEVRIALPEGTSADRVRAVIDRDHKLLVLYVDDWPIKPYPLTGDARLVVGETALTLRATDRRELATLLTPDNLSALPSGRKPALGDRDDDGIPDPLDLLIGAHKTAINKASYGAGYTKLAYPGGDVPRDRGVCTDVVVRATRNAGLDIQSGLHRDISRAPGAYPMVTGKGNRNIDHRRVKTLLPYFKRHFDERETALDDPADPLRPGDVVFMDTFPRRSGPDHIGVVSDRIGASGHPLIINNWTYGTVTAEMDLLDWVPVTHRFRL